MKKRLLLTLLLFLSAVAVSRLHGQVRYAGKGEVRFGVIASPKYDCDVGQSCTHIFDGEERSVAFGVSAALVNGISFADRRAYAGIGIGYLDAEGIVRGYEAFGNLEYLFLKSRVSPLIDVRGGYSRLHNRHNGLTEGSGLFGIAGGLNVRFARELGAYLKAGLRISHDSHLYSLCCGIRF